MGADEDIGGVVFDVQRFSVHDGPGIRTTVFFKGCPLRCRWCQNPEGLERKVELAHWAERCTKCGECVRACPRDAIHGDGAHVDRSRCDLCGLCTQACPNGALQLVGRTVRAGDLAREALRDRSFFDVSGGGVTLSGGEPTWQTAFLGALARILRREGASVGLQTCGAFSWSGLEPLLELFAFVLFDVKLADSERHRAATGSANDVILANAKRLVARGAPVTFRMPVVPGINDDVDNVRGTAELLRALQVNRIALLRYHAMGEAKLVRLGSRLAPLGLAGSPRAAESLARARDLFLAEGIEVAT